MERIKSRGIIAIGIINFLFGVTLALWGLGVIIVMISSGTYFGIIASIPFLIISYGFIVVGRQVLELELKGMLDMKNMEKKHFVKIVIKK